MLRNLFAVTSHTAIIDSFVRKGYLGLRLGLRLGLFL